MGNFVSSMGATQDKDNAVYTEDGALLEFTIKKYSNDKVIVESADILPTWVKKTKDKKFIVVPLEEGLEEFNNLYE